MRKKDRLYPWEAAALLTLCALLLIGVWARGRQEALASRLIRLHVIAASDSAGDQAAKLAVRDAALSLLEPLLAEAGDVSQARDVLREAMPALEETARDIAGTAARASLSRESYPTRVYEGFSLPAGRYLSLRIVLGEGRGRNWWCVVYPPLCSSGAEEALSAGALDDGDVRLITEDGAGYELRFRVLEWWGELTSHWEK